MAEKVLLLSCDSWSMTDKESGEFVKGVSVWFVNAYREDTDTSFGQKPSKVSATPEIFEKLRNSPLPGIYELSYGSRSGAKGVATLTLIDAKYVQEAKFFTPAKATATA